MGQTGRKISGTIIAMLMSAYAVLLIVYSGEIANDIREAVLRCVNVIIPSLFAFMAVTDLMIRSGAYVHLSKLFMPLARLTGIPDALGATFLIANCAGYPTGACAVCRLYDEGALDKKSASRLLCTCYNGGPAFFTGAVGITVFSSKRTGLLIWVSIILANLIAAVVLDRLFPIKYIDKEEKHDFKSDMLSDSVIAAGKGLFNVCVMILIFRTFITLINATGVLDSGGNIIEVCEAFIEISELSSISSKAYGALPLICAAGAFGGLCVIMQIKSLVGKRFSILPFFAARVLCAATAFAISKPLFAIFGDKALQTAAQPELIVNFNNFIPSVCLIMMIFITYLQKRLAFSKQM